MDVPETLDWPGVQNPPFVRVQANEHMNWIANFIENFAHLVLPVVYISHAYMSLLTYSVNYAGRVMVHSSWGCPAVKGETQLRGIRELCGRDLGKLAEVVFLAERSDAIGNFMAIRFWSIVRVGKPFAVAPRELREL